jgi:hypothetical protein
MHRDTIRELLVFALLLAFGVIGRWAQPLWNFTPLAAVTAMGAFYFRGWLPAILLSASLLVISDVFLLPHDNWIAQIAVHVMAIIPLALGRAARNAEGWGRVGYWAMCGFVPATAFFLVTNFAVWASKSLYPPTMAGLMECYYAGIPFYRWMLAGDVCYVSLMAACVAAAQLIESRAFSKVAAVPVRNEK